MAVKRYDGSAWQTVAGLGAQGPAATSSSIATWVKTATGGETSVSGNDDNSQPLSYTVGQELVFINGALQKRGADYTATTGNSITGLTALAANDVVTVWTVNAFSVTNAISNTLVDAKGDILTATSADVPARLAVGANNTVLTADSSTATGLKWAAPGVTFSGCSAYNGSNLTIANATWTNVQLNSELFDTDGFHSTTTNNTRFTVPSGKGGYYLLTAAMAFQPNATGQRILRVLKNGSAVAYAPQITASAVNYVGPQIAVTLSGAVSDYFEFGVFQNSGGNLDTTGGSSDVFYQITYLGA